MARVTVCCGPDRSGRAAAMDARLAGCWRQSRLILPAPRHVGPRLAHFLDTQNFPGACGKPIVAFQDFVEELLAAEGLHARAVESLERELLLQQAAALLEAEGRLNCLGDAAGSQGFRAHALQIITRLKQSAIEPAEFRRRIAQRSEKSPLDEVIADLYEAYQTALHAAGAYDTVGLFWSAHEIASRRRPKSIEGVRALYLDGFDDFTASEFRVLAALEPHLEELAFGIRADLERPSAADLYALPSRTVEALQRLFPAARVEHFPEPAAESAIAFATRELFWRNAPGEPPKDATDIVVHAADSARQEAAYIGQRIKTLVIEYGAALEEIAVVYRDLTDSLSLLRSVLDEYGIPYDSRHPQPLAASTAGAFAVSFIDAVNTCAPDACADLVASPWFAPDGPANPELLRLFAALIPIAGVAVGFDEWRAGLTRLHRAFEHARSGMLHDVASHQPRLTEALALLTQRVERLAAIANDLPKNAPLATHVDAFANALRAAGFPPAAFEQTTDRDAWQAVDALLGKLAYWRGGDDTSMKREDFLSLLRTMALREGVTPTSRARGVALLDAESVRGRRFDYVFFAGLCEGVVPRPPAVNAIYSDDDISDLCRAGIELEGREEHNQREMLLFHQVLSSPRKQLIAVWPAQNAKGRAQLPSPYLRDLLALFPGMTPQPAAERPACPREAANAVFMHAAMADAIAPETAALISEAAAIDRRRSGRTRCDVYDGQLEDAEVVAFVADKFGARHEFSVGQLETYIACPFQFWTQRVMNLAEMEEPAAGLEARLRGVIVHAALQSFHEHYRGRAVSELALDEALRSMDDALDSAFSRIAPQSMHTPPAVLAAEREGLGRMLARYVTIEHARDDASWKPSHFEVTFGAGMRESSDPLYTAKPFAIERDGSTILLNGRIDRIDLDAQDRARIIDYKSGLSAMPTNPDIDNGLAIQLGCYAVVLEEHLKPGTQCAEALLLAPGRKKTVEALGRTKDKWPARREAALDAAVNAARAIRGGTFTPTPRKDACLYCPFRRACRYEAWRIDAKLGNSGDGEDGEES